MFEVPLYNGGERLKNLSMQMFGNTVRADGFDTRHVVTRVHSPAEAKALPRGAVVGDLHGGVTFSDAVANVLEQRSHTGWLQMKTNGLQGTHWTVIVLNR